MPPLESRWYWDRRNDKAYYPVELDDDTVAFATVWHREEIADALEGGALVPIDEIGLDRSDTAFDLVDSFRMPDEPETLGNYDADDRGNGDSADRGDGKSIGEGNGDSAADGDER